MKYHKTNPPLICLIITLVFYLATSSSLADEKKTIFAYWDDVINAPYSSFFYAEASDTQLPGIYANNHPWLSEEILFVQSNTRMLVCQNPLGELLYAAVPAQVYPVPTNHGIPNGLGYEPGMYYHFDAEKNRKPGYWEEPAGLSEKESVFDVGEIAVMESTVAPFLVRGPHDYELYYLTAGKSRHFPAEYSPGISLPANDLESEQNTSLDAIPRFSLPDGRKMEKTIQLPVSLIPVKNYKVPKNK